MSRPLLVSDCDEVLLHMVVPFQGWLDTEKHIHFDLERTDFVDALRHKHDGTLLEPPQVWPLLQAFFDTEMHRQQAIDGAVAAIAQISEIADVAILTNLLDDRRIARTAQLQAVGIDFPVHTNQGGKGRALEAIIANYDPSVVVFVDDLCHQHESVAEHLPHVWRLQMVGEPLLARYVKGTSAAHARIDRWDDALPWILDKFASGAAAPLAAIGETG
ncbi:MAG: HAD family hydrolase [Parasphingorhabdus sp.]|nr:HAD family hydrolase [Parasphingorhabdus sp.]